MLLVSISLIVGGVAHPFYVFIVYFLNILNLFLEKKSISSSLPIV